MCQHDDLFETNSGPNPTRLDQLSWWQLRLTLLWFVPLLRSHQLAILFDSPYSVQQSVWEGLLPSRACCESIRPMGLRKCCLFSCAQKRSNRFETIERFKRSLKKKSLRRNDDSWQFAQQLAASGLTAPRQVGSQMTRWKCIIWNVYCFRCQSLLSKQNPLKGRCVPGNAKGDAKTESFLMFMSSKQPAISTQSHHTLQFELACCIWMTAGWPWCRRSSSNHACLASTSLRWTRPDQLGFFQKSCHNSDRKDVWEIQHFQNQYLGINICRPPFSGSLCSQFFTFVSQLG